MQKDERVSRYDQAAAILPSRLRKAASVLSDGEKAAAEEIRLRAGRPLSVLLPAGELPLEALVEPEDLETLCDIATEFSRYAASETIREGFLPVRGGFRVGLCALLFWGALFVFTCRRGRYPDGGAGRCLVVFYIFSSGVYIPAYSAIIPA